LTFMLWYCPIIMFGEIFILFCWYKVMQEVLLKPYKEIKRVLYNVDHYLRKYKWLLLSVSAIMILYKYRYEISSFVRYWCTPQGSEVKALIPDTEKVENHWKKPIIEPIVGMCKTIVGDDLGKLLENNVAFAEFTSEDKKRYNNCNILPLGDGCYLVPYHVMVKKYFYINVIYHDDKCIGPNFKTTYGDSSWHRINKTDVAILFLNQGGSRRNMLKFFPENKPNSFFASKGDIIHRNNTGEIIKYVSRCTTTSFQPCNDAAQDYDAFQVYLTHMSNANTFVGLCGSPVMINGSSPFIGGIHIAGITDTPKGVIQRITRGEIEETIAILKERKVVNPLNTLEEISLQSGDLTISTEPSYKSPLNYLDDEVNTLNYYGTHNKQLREFRSEVVSSKIAESVFKHFGISKTHGPPKNMNSYKPWREQLLSLTNLKNLHVDYLNKAYEDFSTKIFSKLNKEKNIIWKDKLHPLDNDTIVAGNDGVYGIDSINLKTSTGWPTCTLKSKFIKPSDRTVEGISVPLDVDQWIWDEVELCEKKLLKKERILLVHRCNLKDEPTKLTKDKVRVFAGTPIVGLILVRKYFLPICKLMMENSVLFECAVGVNAHGPAWDKLTKTMIKYGADRVIAGDYKHYDGTMSSQISSLALRLYIEIAKWANYSPDQISIMEGLATELTNPLYEFNGDFIMVNGSNPSGHSLTVFVNNIVNSLYLRYTYYKIYKDKPDIPLFHKVVSVICYGDDNKMSVKKGFDEFNHTAISNTLAEDNIIYTMADKEAKSVPFIKNEDCNFLKRKSLYNDEVGLYMAPIEEATLLKMLQCHLKSNVLSREESSIEAITNVSYESFFHGKDFYDDYRDKLSRVIKDEKLEWNFPEGLPTYENRLDSWKIQYLTSSN